MAPRPGSASAQAAPAAETGEPDALMTPAAVAALFGVDAKTVTRWAQAGKIDHIRTLGGHRRFRRTEVAALLAQVPDARTPPD